MKQYISIFFLVLLAVAQSSYAATEADGESQASPKDIVKLSAGPAWITSEVQTPQGKYNRKSGFSLGADYMHLWESGLGIGVNTLYFGSKFDEGIKVRLFYLGPSFVGSLTFADKWRAETSFGLGYCMYKEMMGPLEETSNNLGFLGQIGIEYMVSRNVGIGLHLNSFLVTMKRPEGYNTDKYDYYGLKHIDLMFGVRFYL